MGHIDEILATRSGVKVRLVDIIGKDTADSDVLRGASTRHSHEDEQ